MSDTPRTDAIQSVSSMQHRDGWEHARTLERELADLMEACAPPKPGTRKDDSEVALKAYVAYAEQQTKALRRAKCAFEIINDRHYDEQDCDQDADGHRTPNRDMNTVVDCSVAIGEIDRALAKNPNPSGQSRAEASVAHPPEASGPVGLGPIEFWRKGDYFKIVDGKKIHATFNDHDGIHMMGDPREERKT